MAAMRMMQMTVDQVIHMVSMRHRRMPAVQSVHMVGRMRTAFVPGRAVVRVGARHADRVFIVVVFMVVVQVAIMQIVHMVVVPYTRVTAPRAMRVNVIGVGVNRVMHLQTP
jgi:hypothetical protein